MQRLHVALEERNSDVRECYGDTVVRCTRCKKNIPVLEAGRHARQCTHDALHANISHNSELQAMHVLARSNYGLLRPFITEGHHRHSFKSTNSVGIPIP